MKRPFSRLCAAILSTVVLLSAPLRDRKRTDGEAVLWHNPGHVEALDLAHGPGGKRGEPKPSFTFVEEDHGGTSPKIKVTDANGAKWSVKFGEEVRAENFASRLAWAVGYFVETNYYVASGVAIGAKHLKRAKAWVNPEGQFTAGRFQLRSKEPEFLKDFEWAWDDNPFTGSRELNGLRIIMMLTSNWDNKDKSDHSSGGSNNFVFRAHDGPKARLLYEVTDWGATMGKWGNIMSRSKWNCRDYLEQTPGFVKGVKDGVVEWGYHGKHTNVETRDIRVSDVKWLLQYLGRLTADQIRAGLEGSGATPEEVPCYLDAIRQRIDQLRGI